MAAAARSRRRIWRQCPLCRRLKNCRTLENTSDDKKRDRRIKARDRNGPANDELPVFRGNLARMCGIRTPEVRLELADTKFPVALVRRFDRRGSARIPYISARTALGEDRHKARF